MRTTAGTTITKKMLNFDLKEKILSLFKAKTKGSINEKKLAEHAADIEVKIRNSKNVKVLINNSKRRSKSKALRRQVIRQERRRRLTN